MPPLREPAGSPPTAPLTFVAILTLGLSSACGGAGGGPSGDGKPRTAGEQLRTLEYQGFLGRASSFTALQVAMGYERDATDLVSRFRGDWIKVLGVVGGTTAGPPAAVTVGSGLGGEDRVVCQPLDPAWTAELTPGQPIVVLGKGRDDAGHLILSDCVWESELAADVVEGIVPEALPEGLAVEVRSNDILGTTKRTMDVRLDRKLTAGQLRTLAFKLKYEDPGYYEQTRILFRIPTMDADGGAWATAVLEDELKLTIHGLSLEAQRTLGPAPPPGVPDGARVLGSWFGESTGGSKTTIYEVAGAFHLVRETPTASEPARRSLRETPSKQGKRFDDVAAEHGEFYLITDNGHLQSWDDDGQIATAHRASPPDL